MKKELLVKCLLCGQGGFTTRGLRGHWCPKKPAGPGHKRHSAPLTREEWQNAIMAAMRREAR